MRFKWNGTRQYHAVQAERWVNPDWTKETVTGALHSIFLPVENAAHAVPQRVFQRPKSPTLWPVSRLCPRLGVAVA